MLRSSEIKPLFDRFVTLWQVLFLKETLVTHHISWHQSSLLFFYLFFLVTCHTVSTLCQKSTLRPNKNLHFPSYVILRFALYYVILRYIATLYYVILRYIYYETTNERTRYCKKYNIRYFVLFLTETLVTHHNSWHQSSLLFFLLIFLLTYHTVSALCQKSTLRPNKNLYFPSYVILRFALCYVMLCYGVRFCCVVFFFITI